MNASNLRIGGNERRRALLLIGLAGVVALCGGFLAFSSAECDILVRHASFGWMWALCFGGAAALAAVIREAGGWRWAASAAWPGRVHAALIALAWVWILGMDAPGYKVLFDEPVLASTSFTLHTERELATTTRAYPIDGLFTVLRAYLDKRPPLFPFLAAAAHDLTGYRAANAFLVNGLGTLALLWCAWHLGRRYGGGPGGGACAVGLLATLPTLGINATSAGMDLINLAMLAGWWCAALGYVDRPTPARAALLVMVTALLSYCRYESVLYVGSAALIWTAASLRARRWLLTPVWALLPLALVLYAWHNTVLSHSPLMWELRPEQTNRFSFEYAPGNLAHAWRFFLATGWTLPNSPLLTVAGLAGGLILAVRRLRRRLTLPANEATALAAAGAGVLGNLALLMCYYWGGLDDPLVARLSLPAHLLLALLAVAGWRELMSWRRLSLVSWRWPGLAIGAALLTLTVPSAAVDRYTALNLMRRNFEWERRVAARFWPAPDLVITNRSPICWLVEGVPAVSMDRARLRENEVRWHLQHHTFHTVLIMQRVLTLGTGGGWMVDSTDDLPANWRLEEVAVKRFGFTLTRVSRLVAIDLPVPSADSEAESGIERPRS